LLIAIDIIIIIMAGISEEFNISVGVHQGPVLSPLLYIIVMDELTTKIGKGLSWELR